MFLLGIFLWEQGSFLRDFLQGFSSGIFQGSFSRDFLLQQEFLHFLCFLPILQRLLPSDFVQNLPKIACFTEVGMKYSLCCNSGSKSEYKRSFTPLLHVVLVVLLLRVRNFIFIQQTFIITTVSLLPGKKHYFFVLHA